MSTTGVIATAPYQVRPIPWRRLVWVAWRRQRTLISATSALLGVFAIYLLVTGLRMRSAWHTVQACTPQRSSSCNFEWNTFKDAYSSPGIISAVFIFAPLLIGAFAGAPLIGRELETGTFRYAWTQGVGRVRWASAMIVLGAVAVGVLTGAFGALISWHDHPLWTADVTARLAANEFPTTGVAIIGWSLRGIRDWRSRRTVVAARAAGARHRHRNRIRPCTSHLQGPTPLRRPAQDNEPRLRPWLPDHPTMVGEGRRHRQHR